MLVLSEMQMEVLAGLPMKLFVRELTKYINSTYYSKRLQKEQLDGIKEIEIPKILKFCEYAKINTPDAIVEIVNLYYTFERFNIEKPGKAILDIIHRPGRTSELKVMLIEKFLINESMNSDAATA